MVAKKKTRIIFLIFQYDRCINVDLTLSVYVNSQTFVF